MLTNPMPRSARQAQTEATRAASLQVNYDESGVSCTSLLGHSDIRACLPAAHDNLPTGPFHAAFRRSHFPMSHQCRRSHLRHHG